MLRLPGSSSLITEEHGTAETDLRQPGLGPLRATAEAAELTQVVSGLVGMYGYRHADSGPLSAPPAVRPRRA
jgi:hypothetical protein